MSDIIIIPDSGTINFIPSSTIVSKIEGSGNDLNISNTAASGKINISGAFFVNGNQVSYSGHTHSTDSISNLTGVVNNLISGYYDPSIVRTTGNQTISGQKTYNNVSQFNNGIYINASHPGNSTNRIYCKTLDSDLQKSIFTIVDNNYNNIIDIRNNNKISIGTNFPSPFGGYTDKVSIKADSTPTDNALNIIASGNNKIFSVRNDGKIYCGLPINGIYPKFFIRSDSNSSSDTSFRIDGQNVPGIFEIRNNGNLLIGNPSTIGGSPNSSLSIRASTNDSSSYALHINDSSFSPILFARNDGRIGIKTSNPTYQLHVIGSGIFTSGLIVNNSPVSLSGHNHSVSDITNFQTSVSGLIPVKSLSSSGTGIIVNSISGDYSISFDSNLDFNQQNLLVKDPHGFIDLSTATLSFIRPTRTFRISPTGSDFTFYHQGKKYIQSGILSIRLPVSNGLYGVYLNNNSELLYKTTPFDYSSDLPVSLIYYNSATDTVFFTDNRNYVNNNSNIINYFNNSIGIAYYSGLLANYTINGSGTLTSDATIGFSNGSIIDNDKIINIVHSDTPTNIYEQRIYPTGHLPVLFRISPNFWRSNKNDSSSSFDSPLPYIKIGNVPSYNRKDVVSNIWETAPVQNNNYVAYWICATTNLYRPIISIMGQRSDSVLSDAESLNSWDSLELDGLPSYSIKPIYRLIYQSNSSYTNALGARLVSVSDLRNINHTLTKNDHNLLYNLSSNDDHKQYMHINISRSINANHVFNNGITFYDSTIQTTAWTGSVSTSQVNNLNAEYIVRTTGNQNIYGEKIFYGSNEFTPILDMENNLVKIKAPNTDDRTYFFLGLDGNGLPPSDNHADRSVVSRSVGQIKEDLAIESSDIIDFNSSVSGLLPVKDIISGSGISIGSSSGVYTISSFGVAASSASSLVTQCDNMTGSTIPKMTVVYINGGHGNRPTIQKSIAANEAGSSKTYGITATNINDNQTGDVIVFGSLIDVDTNQFGASEGSVLYLSPTTSGAITATKPYAPNHMVAVGKIVRNHNTQGIIEVGIQNGFELAELHNVAVTGVSDGQFLQYNNASGLWVPTSSGNFTTLNVNNNTVWHSGNFDISNIVRTTGTQTINGQKTFNDLTIFNTGIRTTSIDPNGFELAIVNGSFIYDGFAGFRIDNCDYINLKSTTDYINRYASDGDGTGPNAASYSIVDTYQNKTQLLMNSGNIILNENLSVIGSGTLASATINSVIETGTIVSYTHPDNVGSADYDIIISGALHLTRGTVQGIYNLVGESYWDSALSPSGTLWNKDGWTNLSNIKSRSYVLFYDLWGGGLGSNVVGSELIMKHIDTDRYWKIKFNSWAQGQNNGAGGFSYDRQEITNVTGDSNLKVFGSTDIKQNISVSGSANIIGSVASSGLISKYLAVSGLDLTVGGQSASILLKGYAWYGSANGTCGIGAVLNTSGTFGSSAQFFGFQGFNQNVTQYNSMCFTAGNFPQLFLNTNSNVGINTSTPSYKLDVNGTANIATSLRIDASTASTIASFDASKNIVSLSTSTYPSLTELSYVKGVSSALQTQLNSKQATLTNPVVGTGSANHIAYWTASNTIAHDSGSLYWDATNNRLGINTSSPTVGIDANNDTIRLRTARTPASGTATGAIGEICWDNNYVYVCVATNTWKRASLVAW
jgi:hypothetical protein